MPQLALSNVIQISVSQTPTGISNFNTSNLALFSTETPSPSFSDGYKIYLDATEVGTDFGTDSVTYAMALAVFSQNPNILLPGGYLVVIPFEVSETLDAAITRTKDLVQYFGVMSTQIESQADMLAAAAVIQTLIKIGFFVQTSTGSIDPGGSLDLLRSGSYTQSRGLFYDSTTDDALNFQAAYAGRALSTVFAGSNTTQTMHLKQLATIQPDPAITQTLLDKAQTAGADCYPSIQGFPCVFCSGANDFFDEVYNLLWLAGALQVAGFNYLASTSTKVTQTETGMDGLKGAYRAVMDQAVSNAYLAPGQWNSSQTFGNQADFYANISQFGYYIYSSPIASQSQADRADRKAPLVQIAAKEAGAIHSSSVIVIVNP
jgi:Protein of unknown function (DUF3383)